MSNVMVFAVHPDDETLGCGGTILKHKKMGDHVAWCIMTEQLFEEGYTEKEINDRKNQIDIVSKAYSFDSIHELGFPTTCLDQLSMNQLIQKISGAINEVKPEILYIPFKNDIHSDHRVSFEAIFSCTKIFRYPFIKKVYMMEIPSETDFAPGIAAESFIPNYYVNISDFFFKKIEVLKVFESEIKPHPFPRSLEAVEALAKLRGVASNCRYAEGFMLLKEVA